MLPGVLALAGLGFGGSPAGAAEPEHFYEVAVQAMPIYGAIERDGFLLSPVLNSNVLETSAAATLSGDRSAVASLIDPGPVSDAAGLVGVVFPQLPTLPIPPYAYTLRSSSDKPDRERSLGPLTSRVHSEEEQVLSQGIGHPFRIGNFMRIAGMAAESKVTLGADGVVRGVATATLTGLDIGGIVQIGSARSTTVVSSSRTGSSSRTTTELSGVRALGFDAVIDRQGARIIGTGGAVVSNLTIPELNQKLQHLFSTQNFSLALVEANEQRQPADGVTKAVSSGSALEIKYDLIANFKSPVIQTPAIGIALPVGDGIPTKFRFAFGRTTGSVLSGAVPPVDVVAGASPPATRESGTSDTVPLPQFATVRNPADGLRNASRSLALLGIGIAGMGFWQTRRGFRKLEGLAAWLAQPRKWES